MPKDRLQARVSRLTYESLEILGAATGKGVNEVGGEELDHLATTDHFQQRVSQARHWIKKNGREGLTEKIQKQLDKGDLQSVQDLIDD